MKSALKRLGFLSRVIISLLAMSVALLPFHAHDVAAADSDRAAIVLSDAGQDRGDAAPDTAPDGLKGECAACVLMKQIECPATLGRSDVIQITERVVYPVSAAWRSRRPLAEHFRPPCSVHV